MNVTRISRCLAFCFALSCALLAAGARAQERTSGGQPPIDAKAAPAGGDQTLVIPPATNPDERQPPSGGETPPPQQDTTPPDIGSDNAPLPADVPAPQHHGPLPYLGVSVLYTASMRNGQQISALEVTGVDSDSPAARAGLKPGKPATTVGASTATAGELLGPVDAALRPLLAKSGQLGEDGDLIVAIDDHRVTSDADLPDRLARLNPGDIIYLTVLRQRRDGSYQTVKLPVTLGLPKSIRAKESAR
jgi:hypothetical protein